jgi:hypothetical protein
MNKTWKVLAVLALGAAPAFAGEQSAQEKGKAAAHDVKRQARKSGHRVDEALCIGTKAECEAAKAKHRAKEGKDKVSDEAKELKDKVDTDAR